MTSQVCSTVMPITNLCWCTICTDNNSRPPPSPAAPQIGQQFDCLSLTLEMPFKDCDNQPEPRLGFSPQRAKGLGAAFLTALHQVYQGLR